MAKRPQPAAAWLWWRVHGLCPAGGRQAWIFHHTHQWQICRRVIISNNKQGVARWKQSSVKAGGSFVLKDHWVKLVSGKWMDCWRAKLGSTHFPCLEMLGCGGGFLCAHCEEFPGSQSSLPSSQSSPHPPLPRCFLTFDRAVGRKQGAQTKVEWKVPSLYLMKETSGWRYQLTTKNSLHFTEAIEVHWICYGASV